METDQKEQMDVLLVTLADTPDHQPDAQAMNLAAETSLAITVCNGMDAALANLTCCATDAVVLVSSSSSEHYWDALATLNGVRPFVPLIVVSDENDDEAALATFRAGAEDFLVAGDGCGRTLAQTIRFAVERSRVREAHRHVQNYDYATFEQAAVGIAHVGLDGEFLRLNERLCRFLGYSRQELMEKSLEQITHPADIAPDRAHMDRLLSGEVPRYTLEKRYICRDGSIVWGNLTVALATEVNGDPAFFISVVEDITERKLAEVALREGEARFRRLIESNVFGVMLARQDGRITYANQSLLKLLGYTSQDLEAGRMHWNSITPDEYWERDTQAMRELKSTGTCAPYEKDFLAQDGRRIPVLVGCSVLDESPEDGPLIAVSVTNLTDLKNVEEALRISEERFMTALKESPITVFNQDIDLRYTWLHNPAWNMSDVDFLGRNDFETFEERADAEITTLLKRRVLESGVGLRQEVLIHANGIPYYFDLTVEPLRDMFGSVIGVTCAAMDITHLKQMERSEREQRILAEALRDVAIALNRHQEFGSNLDRIIDNIQRVVRHDVAEVMMLEDNHARVIRGRGYHSADLDAARGDMQIDPQAVPWFKQILETHQPAIVPDITQDPSYASAHLPRDPAWRSLVGVPVLLSDEIVGFVVLMADEPGVFTPVHLDRLQAFAEMVTIAVQNVQSSEQQQALAAVQERQRLARELHDAVSQTLFSATIMAEALTRLADRHPERLRDGLVQLHRLNQGALAEMRTLLLELRPASMASVDFAELVVQLADAVRSRKRIAINVEVASQLEIPSDVKFAFYRITQEALNNVAKHAQATTAHVVGWQEDETIMLTVYDDGRGFDPAEVPSTSLGLGIMEERARAVGARFELTSQPQQGTRIQVLWPDPDRGADESSSRTSL